MADIVERLRAYASDDHERLCKGREYTCSCGYDDKRDPLMTEAADTITALRAKNERLRAALREIEALEGGINPSNYSHDDVLALNNSSCEAFDIAHAALDTQPAPKEDRT